MVDWSPLHPPELLARDRQAVRVPPYDGSRLTSRALERTDWLIAGERKGLRLRLRNKRLEGPRWFGPERTVLMVHGATFASEAVFDLAYDGYSWMDHLAAHAFDVWAVDLAGYGGSTSIADDRAECSYDSLAAAADVTWAAKRVLESRGVERLCLLGWSWGASVTGVVATQSPSLVERLVLFAPQWVSPNAYLPMIAHAGEGRERTVREEHLRRERLSAIARGGAAALTPDDRFECWLDTVFRGAPTDAPRRSITVPNGSLREMALCWSLDRPTYDPALIRSPTLVVCGAHDDVLPSDMSRSVFRALTGAARTFFVEIGEGGHDLHMEVHRDRLFMAVLKFLLEGRA